ncbi:hypothetical protein ACF0H5_015714 [Mactra antiquata]
MIGYNLILIVLYIGSTLSALSEWSVLLWLRSDENMDPASVWSDNSSSYNSDTNETVALLLSTNRAGYRNTLIHQWSDNPPDRIKLTYRNNDGTPVFDAVFNTTGTTSEDWFNEINVLSGLDTNWKTRQFLSYDRHNASFLVFDGTWGTKRYVAASLTLYNGTVLYVVGNKRRPVMIPTNNTETNDCYPSIGVLNPLSVNMTVHNLTHKFCSSICRERNYLYGAVHNITCSCIPEADVNLDTSVNLCSIPCEGDSGDLCGGEFPDSVIFNLVQTGIDVPSFDQPLQTQGSLSITEYRQVSYPTPRMLYGFNITINPSDLPANIDMYIYHRTESCSDTSLYNITSIQTFSMGAGDAFYMLDIQPILVQCMYIYLCETGTINPIPFTVDMDVITLQGSQFATVDILSIEAAWEIPDICECQCWLYDLMYKDSPYDNLTYDELEVYLRGTIDEIVKNLTLNVSTLSSTIRKKTSADDGRQSATAIGYSLGVSILVFTLTAIVLADLPKLLVGMKLLHTRLFNKVPLQTVKPAHGR